MPAHAKIRKTKQWAGTMKRKNQKNLPPPPDFSVAFNFKCTDGVPIEIVKFLEWSPLQGQRLRDKRSSVPTKRKDPRSRGFLSQDEVVEILLKDYDISLSRQGLTYLEQATQVSSVKPHVVLALCDILNMSLEDLYIA